MVLFFFRLQTKHVFVPLYTSEKQGSPLVEIAKHSARALIFACVAQTVTLLALRGQEGRLGAGHCLLGSISMVSCCKGIWYQQCFIIVYSHHWSILAYLQRYFQTCYSMDKMAVKYIATTDLFVSTTKNLYKKFENRYKTSSNIYQIFITVFFHCCIINLFTKLEQWVKNARLLLCYFNTIRPYWAIRGYSKRFKTNSTKYFINEIYKIIFLHSFHPIHNTSVSDVSIEKFHSEKFQNSMTEFFDGNIAYRSVMNWMETM